MTYYRGFRYIQEPMCKHFWAFLLHKSANEGRSSSSLFRLPQSPPNLCLLSAQASYLVGTRVKMPYTGQVVAVCKTLHILFEVHAGAIIIPRIMDVHFLNFDFWNGIGDDYQTGE